MRLCVVLSTLVFGACASRVGPGGDGHAGDASTDGSSEIFCELPNDGRCPAGQSCPAGDGCNICACSANGVLACTLRDCAPVDVTVPCRTSAECASGQRCEYPGGSCMLAQMGHCVDAAHCESLPVSMPYCGCDGTTFDPGACPPDRPYEHTGACAARDGGTESTRFPGAIMAWQAPGGFAGTGPAVVVTSDGAVRVYANVAGFNPTGALPPPDRTITVTIAEVDDLFMRWFNTPTPGLPHPSTGGGECSPSVYTRLCTSCTPREIGYQTPSQLLPEMDNVWRWFDDHVRGLSPRTFCGG